MDQKKPNRRPQKLDTQGIRGLVFALAVSSTIGFWAIFSRAESIQSSEGGSLDESQDGLSEFQDENQTAFDLPPIPTLIPTADQTLGPLPVTAMSLPISIPGGNPNANPTQIAPPPIVNKPVRDSSKPEKPKQKREKNTTSTKSS
jgi:hypothetical protein